jgi:hypothetical protein
MGGSTEEASQTGNTRAKKSPNTPRATNHAPTSTRIQPPHRFMVGPAASSRAASRSWAKATVSAETEANRAMANPATTNAVTAAEVPPTLSACPARPARIGPVHPKPMA